MVSVLFSLLVSLAALVVVDAAPTKRNGSFPGFVTKYAPFVYLHSDEQYWPSDIATHLLGVIPQDNYTTVGGTPTLQTLSTYGPSVYLTALDDVLSHDSPFFTSDVGKPVDGTSTAPATIIVAEKSGGIVDAFYFYFHSWNDAPPVLGLVFGDHVSDWEHTMVRFVNGTPTAIWYSQHSNGAAYTYSAVNKIGDRPISYSAIGSHANYPTSGKQPYGPLELLSDNTNQGPMWDVTKNYRGYYYDVSTGNFSLATGAGSGGKLQHSEGSSWLEFEGFWGDQVWQDWRYGQYHFDDQYHISSGATGPPAKNLGRTTVCQNDPCTVLTSLS